MHRILLLHSDIRNITERKKQKKQKTIKDKNKKKKNETIKNKKKQKNKQTRYI